MNEYFSVEISGENRKYFYKEGGSGAKMATIKALWRLVNPVLHKTQEDIRRCLVPIKDLEIDKYYRLGYIICAARGLSSGRISYYGYQGKVDNF